MIFADPDGATPISPAERDELIPDHIATREQLNEFPPGSFQSLKVVGTHVTGGEEG